MTGFTVGEEDRIDPDCAGLVLGVRHFTFFLIVFSKKIHSAVGRQKRVPGTTFCVRVATS